MCRGEKFRKRLLFNQSRGNAGKRLGGQRHTRGTISWRRIPSTVQYVVSGPHVPPGTDRWWFLKIANCASVPCYRGWVDRTSSPRAERSQQDCCTDAGAWNSGRGPCGKPQHSYVPPRIFTRPKPELPLSSIERARVLRGVGARRTCWKDTSEVGTNACYLLLSVIAARPEYGDTFSPLRLVARSNCVQW